MKQKILTALRRSARTKADLAVDLGASYGTVSKVVGELQAEGKLKATPVKTGKRGRPAIKYSAVRTA